MGKKPAPASASYGRERPNRGPGMDWTGAWKAWVAKDAIKPVNMTASKPPVHSFNARSDNPMNTTVIGGPNAPCRITKRFERYDPKEGPSDRTKEHAKTFEHATSGVSHDPLAAYHPPADTKLPIRRPEEQPDRWVPMSHQGYTTMYNPLTHKRTDITKEPLDATKGGRDPKGMSVTMKRGDKVAPPGNFVSAAEALAIDPTAYRRRKGVTEFMDVTHPFKPNFSDNYAERINRDPKVFYRQQGAMVTWMHAAVVGKSKIPFRKTQPPGV
mmetsp:Transcript_6691/g.16149  ORF Transcript_6691/g.16149 Transcript_6691/m.16149 type:complete len:270 (+) Transcript_6691:84-893(+)